MKRYKVLLICLILFTFLITGCNGNSNDNIAEVDNASNSSYKKHIKIGIYQAITSGDPHVLSNTPHNMLFNLSHNTLVSLDSSDMTYYPELAKDWKWISDKILELNLRDDVSFQNGSPMTADDVVFTFDRAKNSNTVGAKINLLDSVKALDKYTIQMSLNEANVDWLDTLALPMCSIISKEATESDDEAGPYIGTGAWVIKELAPSNYVELTRNDSYWGEHPKTEVMTLRYIPEDSARLIALQNGEIDICIKPSNTELHFIEDDPDLTLYQYDSTNCSFICFNTSKPPCNDQNIRLAIAHAINVDDIITVGADGLGTKAVTSWGNATYGYYDGFGPYRQDLELAKEYLKKAFPNGGATLEVSCSGSQRMAIAQLIQEQCRQIGLEIKINELEAAALTAHTAFKTAEHQAMIYGMSWNMAGDDARRAYYAGSNTNKAILTNEHIMELLDKAAKETDDTARKAMYREIQEINHEQAYYIPFYYAIESAGINKNLSGVIWQPHRSHDFTYACIIDEN